VVRARVALQSTWAEHQARRSFQFALPPDL